MSHLPPLPHLLVPAVAAIAILAAACGGGSSPDADGDDVAAVPTVAGTCLEGAADCQDTGGPGDEPPLLYDEPDGGVAPGGAGLPLVIDGGLSVADALTTDAAGPLAVGAFFFSDGESTWLCDSLAESYPPQCAGERVAFEGASAIDPDELDETQGITWSAQPVTVIGSIVDGTFVATTLSQ